jgi:hypothetical protein
MGARRAVAVHPRGELNGVMRALTQHPANRLRRRDPELRVRFASLAIPPGVAVRMDSRFVGSTARSALPCSTCGAISGTLTASTGCWCGCHRTWPQHLGVLVSGRSQTEWPSLRRCELIIARLCGLAPPAALVVGSGSGTPAQSRALAGQRKAPNGPAMAQEHRRSTSPAVPAHSRGRRSTQDRPRTR